MVDQQSANQHQHHHAVSAYSPNRRNQTTFLQDPSNIIVQESSSNKLSTITLGLALIIIRFWKDARIWKELLLRLPLPKKWLVFVTANLQKWQGSTTNVLKRVVWNVLKTLQEQLSPFLLTTSAVLPTISTLPTSTTAAASSASNNSNISNHHHLATSATTASASATTTDAAPTSTILCNSSSDVGGESSSAMTDTHTTQPSSSCFFTYYEDRVRQNQSLIHKVLNYWFGQYTPDEAQKKLWMIANSSIDWRRKVDSEITDLFTPLLIELASASASTESSSGGTGGTMQQEQDGGGGADTTTTAAADTTVAETSPQPPPETTTASKKPSQQQQPCRWQQWCADKDLYGYQGKLAAIIVLDQFSRHIRRHQQEEANQLTDNNLNVSDNNTILLLQELPSQSQLDSLAFETAQALTKDHEQEIQCGMIPIPQYIFGLMPYRHANTLESVQYVQNCVTHTASLNIQFDAMTSRFRKATNRRMAILQDEARRTGNNNNKVITTTTPTTTKTPVNDVENENTGTVGKDQLGTTITTTTTQSFSDEDILETFPFEADMTDAMDHPVVKTIQSFLADQGIYPIGGRGGGGGGGGTTTNRQTAKKLKSKKKKNSNNNQTKKNKKKNDPNSTEQQQPNSQSSTGDLSSNDAVHSPPPLPPTRSVIISLSGGVDSMVIASVLAFLKSSSNNHLNEDDESFYYPHLNIVAIHIDYANRPESKAESDYVQNYCQQKGIRFVVRRIEEVTRGITARDEYEQRARQMRYDMYRSVAKECLSEQSEQQQQQHQSIVGVMLGHHRGDLRENVLSNAHKGCGPLDLSGMTAVSQNDGVTIYRPLLPLEKTEVYDYAHRYGVPYFKDTTPHWSTRGKLRNKLLPLLEEIYGEGSMNNLSTLATESDECRHLLHNSLLKPFMDKVVRSPMGIMFETAPFRSQGLFFWKFVLREVLHSAGLGMFSDKSVLSFLERILPLHTYKKTIREGWLQCRRDYAVYLQEDGKIFVFYPDSLPWRKSDCFKCQDEFFDLTQQTTIAVGPWIIEVEQCDIEAEERADKLKKKAVSSMTDFMQGFIEYYLEVPTIQRDQMEDEETTYSPSPLNFAPAFRKETRPQAWKNTDEKLQEILPLLGLTTESANELKCPTSDNPAVIVRVTLDRRFSSN